jgi:hypothetical protein
MNYEEEIKRLRRLNFKMYMTMANIINILNERETNELYKLSLKSIDKDIIFITEGCDNYEIYGRINNLEEDLIKLKKDIEYLMIKQKEREARVSKYFTYDSTDSE